MNGQRESTLGAVLVVAREREDRRVLFDALDGEPFDAVYTAKDCAQALAFVEQGSSVDLVILDFVASPSDARQLIRQLRELPASRMARVLGISAPRSRLRQDPELHWLVGAWLDAPVGRERVVEAVHGLLGSTQSSQKRVQDPFRSWFEAASDELIVADSRSGSVLEVNPQVERSTGLAAARLSGMPLSALGIGLDAAQWRQFRATLSARQALRLQTTRQCADGRVLAVELDAHRADLDGRPVDLIALRDLSQQQALLQALELAGALFTSSSEALAGRFDTLLRWLNVDLVMLVEAAALPGELARLRLLVVAADLPRVSLAAQQQAALDEVLAGSAREIYEHATRELPDEPWVQALRLESWLGYPLETRMAEDGRPRMLGALLLAGRRPGPLQAPGATAVVAALRRHAALALDTQRLRAVSRMQGLHDALTGLPNRLLFNDRLQSAINESRRTGETFAVLFVDIDRFKTINDSLGHSVGDVLLGTAARRLRASVRSSDTVARYAGDEFTLVLRHIVHRDDALRVAEKICRMLEAPIAVDGVGDLQITASIGVAFCPDDASEAEDLLRKADTAMYAAKAMGRNLVQAYVPADGQPAQPHVALEAKLRTAERNGELRVFYQPKLDVASEDIVGMEALVRWEHPELGMVSPGLFIPLAEDSGLIVSIGTWVLREACRATRVWSERFGLALKVGVNLSVLQLRQPGLAEIVRQTLEETGLPPEQLDLEVTESISIKSVPRLVETLRELRQMGCTIAIDDFGTGQSSLDYLKRFPADSLKIDQTFVRNIGVDPDDEAIVRATVSMAHNMNLAVVAEGVEGEEQLEFLKRAGCEYVQGFLFCRPLPEAAFEHLLAERARLRGELAALSAS